MSQVTITPSVGEPTTWKTAIPWGYQESRKATLDVAHPWGRVNDGSPAPVVRETELTLYLHRRGDTTSLAEALASGYASASGWVSGPVTIADSRGGTIIGNLSEGWEFAPEFVDGQTVTVRLEVTSWGL